MRTKEYDLNVYVVDGVARLSAYEYTYSDNIDDPQPNGTNTSRFTTLDVPMDKAHADEVAFLLGDAEWQAEGSEAWQDYDSPWENMAWLEGAPESIKAWGEALAEYEPEIQHEWELFTFDLKYGERRDVKCLNCDATYPMYRLSWDELVAVRP